MIENKTTENPYAPPNASISQMRPNRRPFGIWTVCAYTFMTLVVTAVSWSLYGVTRLTVVDWAFGTMGFILSAFFILTLHRQRRVSVKIYWILVALRLVDTVRGMSNQGLTYVTSEGGVSFAAGWVICLTILAYLLRLESNGTLR